MQSLWFDSALLSQGWTRGVRITGAGGRIAGIEPGVAPRADDERHALGMPGIPNVHSHAFQRGLAGLTERRGPAAADSFWTWRELMYGFVERMAPEELEALSALAYLEMLEAGFTHVGEFHYLHHAVGGQPFDDPGELAARVVAAAAETGIGLTLLPVLYAHGGFGGAPAAERQRRFVTDRDAYARILESSRRCVGALHGGVVGVAPHSLRAVSPDELRWLTELAAGSLFHVHIAEQLQEVDDCLRWCGRRPVEWLLENAPVDHRWCLVHATHVTPAEWQGIAASGACVGLCPITEANLGDGLFPVADFLSQGGIIGVGSDSNVRVDAGEELRVLEYGQRLVHRGRNLLAGGPARSTGRTLVDASLVGGAQALGCPARLEVGASMDIVSLNVDHPGLFERSADAALDSWVFCGGREMIDCVWRAGERLVTGGRHRSREALTGRYRRALERLVPGAGPQ